MGDPDLAGTPAGHLPERIIGTAGSGADYGGPPDRPVGSPRHGRAPARPQGSADLAPPSAATRVRGAAGNRQATRMYGPDVDCRDRRTDHRNNDRGIGADEGDFDA